MPNIVIGELYYQKISAFKIRYESLCKNYEEISYGLDGKLPICNIEKILNKEENEYKDKFKILELPYNNELFKELTQDALKKNPPFDKTREGKKADAGYKDALIWKTIVYSKEIDECEKLYLFSGDKVFKHEDNVQYLIDEFNKCHKNTNLSIVYVEPDKSIRQKCLQTIIRDNNLIETEIIKLYNLEFILSQMKNINYECDEDVYYYDDNQKNVLVDINFSEFLKEDFEIESAKECEGKYEVIVSFSTDKYKIDNAVSINNRIVYGKMKFIFEKNKSEFKLDSYKLIKIRFQSSLAETLNDISKAVSQLYSDKITEVIQNTVKNVVEYFKKIRINEDLSGMMSSLNQIRPILLELSSGIEKNDKKEENLESQEDSKEIQSKNDKKK